MNKMAQAINNITKKIPNNTIKLLSKATIEPSVSDFVIKRVGLTPNDDIELLYLFNGKTDIIVGISTSRIFKLDCYQTSSVLLSDIISVRHQQNNLFKWDKIECLLKNGKIETFGIYHNGVCKQFCNYLMTNSKYNK